MIQVHWSFLLRGPHNSLFGANQYHFRFPMILYSKQSLNVLTQTEKPHDISDNQMYTYKVPVFRNRGTDMIKLLGPNNDPRTEDGVITKLGYLVAIMR